MKLHEQVKHQAAVIEAYELHIMELNRYLNSSKFDIDTTVQVSDISLRLSELRLALPNESVVAKPTRTISDEDLAYAEHWAKETNVEHTQGGYILEELIKQVRTMI